jgi:hypothetical protein
VRNEHDISFGQLKVKNEKLKMKKENPEWPRETRAKAGLLRAGELWLNVTP